jgi:putative MFS transporter
VTGETPQEERPSDVLRLVLSPTVLVATLGYFVDIYDLLLYRIVRKPSLLALGVPEADTLAVGVMLDNAQQLGLLCGGVLWGALGDRRGRASTLYASILLYSVANLANAFVPDLSWYRALRFLAGLGLAGELGVAITLVSEVLPARLRGWGTTVVASVGVLGAVLAAVVTKWTSWQTAYLVGGGLGLGLLALRVRMADSDLFRESTKTGATRGNVLALFANAGRASRYIGGILLAVPVWYVIGLLVTYAGELGAALGVQGPVTAADAVMASYMGLAAGDLTSGALSQWLKSRRKVVGLYLGLTTLLVVAYFTLARGLPATAFLGLCGLLGFAAGYWAMAMQSVAEQFGTNLRATATTTATNVVRACVVPMGLAMKAMTPSLGLPTAVALIGVVVMGLSFTALFFWRETFGRSLAFEEE